MLNRLVVWERFLKMTALLSNLIPPNFSYLTNLVSVSFHQFLSPRYNINMTDKSKTS